jgi:hypothetical protein
LPWILSACWGCGSGSGSGSDGVTKNGSASERSFSRTVVPSSEAHSASSCEAIRSIMRKPAANCACTSRSPSATAEASNRLTSDNARARASTA